MNKFIPVFARLLLAQIFLLHIIIVIMGIMNHPLGYAAYQAELGKYGLPALFAPLTVLIQLLAGGALLLGYKTRLAAFVLAGYAVFVAFAMKFNDPIVFMQYLAIAGGMLTLASVAPTACSLDNLGKKSS